MVLRALSKRTALVLIPLLALGGLAVVPGVTAGASTAPNPAPASASVPSLGPILSELEANLQPLEANLENDFWGVVCLAESLPALVAGERVIC
jgi:hypothetical protein